MKRQLMIQQILSIMDVTAYGLWKLTGINERTIGRWVQDSASMGNSSVYQLYYYLHKKDKRIKHMLEMEIKKIEGK